PPAESARLAKPLLVEVSLATAYVIVCIAICWAASLPLVLPDSDTLEFTGMSNLVPLSILAGTMIFVSVRSRATHPLYVTTAVSAYVAILIVHFNVKLGIHTINPGSFDAVFWAIDRAFYPIVTGAEAIHVGLTGTGLPIEHFYLFLFLAMFATSIIIHGNRSYCDLRKVVLASMLVHMIGGLGYLVMPALGPFIYDIGTNSVETARQIHMLGVHRASLAGGPVWFTAHGPDHLAAGLAAMPSLHVASSGVFLYYAWSKERYLLWVYVPLFLFIVNEAIATRWHYLVDIPVGLAVTGIAVLLARYLVDGQHRLRHAGPVGSDGRPAPVPGTRPANETVPGWKRLPIRPSRTPARN
ncbi:MAG TPA: phosphatase PAP2 family protein, partial [Sphingomonadaceae bacterium]|nr:phosphatase PAP2 family protein [Sphingomonadaceae bacterium]